LFEKEDIFENELDVLLLFAMYYYGMLNNDRFWQAQKELKIMTLEEIAKYLKKVKSMSRTTKINGHREGGIYKQFAYLLNFVVYTNSSYMNVIRNRL